MTEPLLLENNNRNLFEDTFLNLPSNHIDLAMTTDATMDDWNNYEKNNEMQEIEQLRKAQQDEELNPKRSCLHAFFNFISLIVIIAAINMGVGQALGIFLQNLNFVEYALRMYVIIICGVIVLNELQWCTCIISNSLLTNWIPRGIIYTFIGVIGMEEFVVKDESLLTTTQKIYIQTVSWGMISSGLLYAVLGLFCIQHFHKNAIEDYDRRVELSKARRREMRSLSVD